VARRKPAEKTERRYTSIRVTEQVWRKLSDLRQIGESYDDALRRILEVPE